MGHFTPSVFELKIEGGYEHGSYIYREEVSLKQTYTAFFDISGILKQGLIGLLPCNKFSP